MTDRPDYIQKDVILAPYTTFKIGGQADYFAKVHNEEQLVSTLTWAKANNLPVMILGGGSNLVFADAGYRGVVISIDSKGIDTVKTTDGVLVTVAAGEEWDEFVSSMITLHFFGLENLSGIPGTVGASPVQNIGAYGIEVGDTIISVRVYDPITNNFYNLEKDKCNFSYRNSFFKTEEGKNFVIVSVTFFLDKIYNPNLAYPDLKKYFAETQPPAAAVRQTVLKIRSQKFPDLSQVGTAGSFFKNPIIDDSHYQQLKVNYPELPGYKHGEGVKISAAWLIDNVAKAKGLIDGTVGTHDKQALVVVNFGGATARELNAFANKISNCVYDKTDVRLEREVCFVAEK